MEILNRISFLLKEEFEEEEEKVSVAVIPKEFKSDANYKLPYQKKLLVKMGNYSESKIRRIWFDFIEELGDSKLDGNLMYILNQIFRKPKLTKASLKPLGKQYKGSFLNSNLDDPKILSLASRLSYSLSLALPNILTQIQPISIIISLLYLEGIIGEEQSFKDIMARANRITRMYMRKPGDTNEEDYEEEFKE